MKPGRTSRRRLILVSSALLALLLAAAPHGSGQTSPAAAPTARPLFQGPAMGSSGTPALQSLSAVPQVVRGTSIGAPVESSREHEIPRIKNPANLAAALAPAGSNEIDDGSRPLARRANRPLSAGAAASPIVSFSGPDYTAKIPPDPIVAVGPNHLVAAVNSKFGIYSKSGTLIFQTQANSWFTNVLPNIAAIGGAFDPKVVYDAAAGRWILVYLATDDKTESWVLISVSSNSDPTGTWCNYALHGDRNGSTASGNWSDYEGVGLDNQALYITTNQFQLTPGGDGSFQYARLRIIPKSQLYSCASITYFDFWDLTDPVSTTERAFTLRPALTFGTPGVEYLVSNSPFDTSTYFTLWSLTNPLSSPPTLTAQNIPVTSTTAPPNADQLGGTGGTSDCTAPCLIDTGDGRLLDLVYRNGSLWTSHAVAGGTGDAYSRARYVRFGVGGGTPTVLEDVSFGVDGCWYYYPAVALDQSNNLGMVFTRSCTDERAGVRYTTRATTDTTLQGSTNLKGGETNYLNPASGKNRWGDYSGAVVDPADPTKLWLFGEYAASTVNNWGTWAGQISVAGGGTGPCVAGANVLCLNGSRFRVSASFQTTSGGGTATAVPLTGDTGYFWFFSSNNVEVVIKVVDGRAVNGRFWVFAGGLTNVNVVLTVTDTQTGATQTYINPQGIAFQPIQDTSAFLGSRTAGGDGGPAVLSRSIAASADAISAGLTRLLEREPAAPASATAPCVANATTLCLNSGRFSVRTVWSTTGGGTGSGQAVSLTGDTGYFWFFSPNNVEMVAKAVTGCPVNNRYWVFAGGLTNVNVVTTVTDTQTGLARTYINPQGIAFQPIQDTNAFVCP